MNDIQETAAVTETAPVTIIHAKNAADETVIRSLVNVDALGPVKILHALMSVKETDGLSDTEITREKYDRSTRTALAMAASRGDRIITSRLFLDQAAEYGELYIVEKPKYANQKAVTHLFAKNIVDKEAFTRLKASEDFAAAFGLGEEKEAAF